MVVMRTQVFWDVTCRQVNYRPSKVRSAFVFRTKQSKDSLLGRFAEFSTAVIFGRYSNLLLRAALIPIIRPLFILGLINKTVINVLRAKCPPTDYNQDILYLSGCDLSAQATIIRDEDDSSLCLQVLLRAATVETMVCDGRDYGVTVINYMNVLKGSVPSYSL